MKKRILLLGSQGNLGSEIKKFFNTHKLISWTRNDCDLTNFTEVKEKILKLKPDVIINTVAYNQVDACEANIKEQEKAILLNVDLIKLLCDISLLLNAQFITFSSNYVFFGEKDSYNEDDIPNPVNFYGLTKKMGEEIVQNYIHKGLVASIIRVANLYGISESTHSSKQNFFDAILSAFEKDKKEKVEIVDDEKCCFTYTKDIAKIIPSFIENPKNMLGIHHVVNSGKAYTWYEAAKIFFEILKQNRTIISVTGEKFKRPALRPKSAVLNITRLDTPKLRSFKEALAEYITNRYH